MTFRKPTMDFPFSSAHEITIINLQIMDMFNCYLVGGYTYPSEKYDFVSWGYIIPNHTEKNMFQTTNQPYHH